jgi:hypothetical protein
MRCKREIRLRLNTRRVVYTALFGEYETLNEQICSNRDDIDFICFTDSVLIESHTWKIVKVPTIGLDSTRESRRPKILAHEYLGADYDESIYIDNSVILIMDPADIFERYLGEKDFVCFRHPWRICLYQEAEVIKKEGIDDRVLVERQTNYYHRMGYPYNNGLIAGTFLLRRHNSESVIRSMDFWFEQVLRYSKRDQMSFNFVAWVCRLKFDMLDLVLNDNPIMRWPVHNNRRIDRAFPSIKPVKEASPNSVDSEGIEPLPSKVGYHLRKTMANYVWHSLGRGAGERDAHEVYSDNPRREVVSRFEHPPRRVLEVGCST